MMKNNVRAFALSLLMPALALAITAPTYRDGLHCAIGAALGAGQQYSGTQDIRNVGIDVDSITKFAFNSAAKATGVGSIHRRLVGPKANQYVLGAVGADQKVTLQDEAYRTLGQLIGSALILNKDTAGNFSWTKPLSVIDPVNALEFAKWALPTVQAEATIFENNIAAATVGNTTGASITVGAAVTTN